MAFGIKEKWKKKTETLPSSICSGPKAAPFSLAWPWIRPSCVPLLSPFFPYRGTALPFLLLCAQPAHSPLSAQWPAQHAVPSLLWLASGSHASGHRQVGSASQRLQPSSSPWPNRTPHRTQPIPNLGNHVIWCKEPQLDPYKTFSTP